MIVLTLILLLSVQGIKSYPRLQPHDLLVESLAYPEGIDTPFPRYSWSLDPVYTI
jgi:hypothetical protein